MFMETGATVHRLALLIEVSQPDGCNGRALGFRLRIYCRDTKAETQLGGYESNLGTAIMTARKPVNWV